MKKIIKYSHFFCLLLVILSYSCNNDNFSDGNKHTKHYDTIKIKTVGQRVYLPVKHKTEIAWYLLDTGAGTVVSKETFKSLDIESLNDMPVKDLYGNYANIPEIIIPQFYIGNTAFNDIRAGVTNRIHEISPKCEIESQGIIGSNVFQDNIIRIDLQKEILIISNSISKYKLSESNSIELKYFGKQKTPVIDIEIPKINFYEEVEFDTGADVFYRMSNDHFNELLKLKKFDSLAYSKVLPGNNQIGLFGQQKDTTRYQFYIDTLSLGNVKFYNLNAETWHTKNSRIGAKLLSFGVVTIDYIQNNLYFENYREGNTINCEAKKLGVNLHFSDKTIKVSKIKNNSILQKSGVRKGDIIYQINNIVIDSLSSCEFILKDWTYELNSDTVYMIFLDENSTKKEVYIH